MRFQLDRFAYHFIDKEHNNLKLTSNEQKVATLHPTILEFFEGLTTKLWKMEDSGTTVSGHFSRAVDPSQAMPIIEEILKSQDTFFENSKRLADLLFAKSPTNSSPGVLVVLICTDIETETSYVALYKVKYKNEKLIKLLENNLRPELEVEEVRNALLRELQKGALIPHPSRHQFDIKVIEGQANEPRLYFRKEFLGCITKKSDEHQVKKLIPELLKYSDERGLPRASEKIPEVLKSLGEMEGNITTNTLLNVIEDKDFYGESFDRNDFGEFLESSENLSQFDVPANKILTKTNRLRKMILTFSDPELDGMVITAPLNVIERIRTKEGDNVVFKIETTESSLNISYE